MDNDMGWWIVTTPYVDAYEHARWENGHHIPIDFEEFKKKMYCQASQWGENGIGSAVLRGNDVARTDQGNPVLAIGTWNNKLWVIIPDPGSKWYEVEYNLVEFAWPQEWNVT